MLILGIETSCDETAAAVVEDGRRVRSNVLFSQEEIHGPFGGVVPELACRRHVIVIQQVVEKALIQADVDVADLSAVAVTQGPGLIGALLVGVCYAKGLAYQYQRPLLAVNHLEGHLAAIELSPGRARPDFPRVALIVSGGHTHLYLVARIGEYRLLGKTRDDAAGEAFDKAAKMLGLGYPGGPIIDRMAVGGDPTAIRFPRPKADPGTFDFSFSGLKTSLKYHLERNGRPTPTQMADIAAGFQQAIVDVLVSRCLTAARAYQARAILVVGGVAANSVLRRTLEKTCDQEGFPLLIPPPALCTDNGAMIAAAGYHLYRRLSRIGRHEKSFLSLSPAAHLPL
jgi:N6-L-threonylcarbamoyladenine synthase